MYWNAFTPEHQTELFRQNQKSGTERLFLLEDAGRNIGMLSLGSRIKGGTGYLEKIYLLPQFWGHGYGRQALSLAIENLRQQGADEIILWVFEKNERARHFYENNGFVYDGVTQPVSPGAALNEMRYRLDLEIRR